MNEFKVKNGLIVNGDTTLNGVVYYSGAPLTQIFATTGSTFVQPNEVLFGSGTSGLTGSSSLSFDNHALSNTIGRLNVGNSTNRTGQIDLYNYTTPTNYLRIEGGADSYITQFGGGDIYFRNYLGNHSLVLQVNNTVRALNFSATTLSAGTLYSGTTNLYNIFATQGASGEANTASNVNGVPLGTSVLATLFKQKTGVDLEFRTLSAGTNISFITGDTITIQATGSGSSTLVQPGLNTYTGGTSAAPTVNISAATLSSVSATTVSGGTLFSGFTNLSTTIISVANAAALANEDVTRVQAGSNIATGGTANAPTVSVIASPSLNNLFLSGSGQFAGATATSFSATSVSATTFFSASTSLATVIDRFSTRVQAGSNIATGGTVNAPTVSVVASPSFNELTLSGSAKFVSITATTLSAATVTAQTSDNKSAGVFINNSVGLSGPAPLRVYDGLGNVAIGFDANSTVPSIYNDEINGLGIRGGGGRGVYIEGSEGFNVLANARIGDGAYTKTDTLEVVGTAMITSRLSATGMTTVNLTGGTISGGTLFSGATNLSTTIISVANAAALANEDVTRVQAGSNIATGGTANAPTVSVIASPSLNNLFLSGSGQFAGVTSTGLSATTLSGGTLFSGATNLSTTIISVAQATGDFTRVQPGLHITTGGTANAPTINLAQNFSGATVSGGTLFSGFTNLSTTIISVANAAALANEDVTRVQAGSNIATGGTANAPTVSVIASPSLNNLFLSGSGQFAGATATSFSATSVSATTFFSASTSLATVIDRFSTRVQAGSNIATGGTVNAPTVSVIASPSLNGLTLSGAGQFAGLTSTGLSATTVSATTFFSATTSLATVIDRFSTRVQAGSNIATGGTGNAPTVSLVASPAVTGIIASGTSSLQATTASSFSANTITGHTYWSGTTTLAQAISNLASGSGEANTASNVGGAGTTLTTSAGLFKQKTGVDLEFRMLSAGTNVTFISGDTITIRATAGSVSISQATIDFGPITSRKYQTKVTVSDPSILTTSKIIAVLTADATSDHSSEEIMLEEIRIASGNIVNGVSFDIFGACTKGTYGQYKVNYTISY